MMTQQQPTKVFRMTTETGQTIIRVSERGKENPYVMITRATLQDSRMSFQARGMLAYLLSKPDNWSVRVGDLMEEGGIGRNQTDNLIKELQRNGYVQRERKRNVHGRWENAEFVVFETPQEPLPDTTL